MLRYLPFILLLALTIYALVDCVRNDDEGLPVALPKGVWVILIVMFPGIGAIAWLIVSRTNHRSGGGGTTVYRTSTPPPSAPPRRPGRPARMRPVAPDDDLDFLASLNNPQPPAGGAPEERSTDSPTATPTDDDAAGPDAHEDGRTAD